ncbi:MAG: hypothetical protein NTU53_16540 [Planctomycetota bacterium]|nr:hypothetical protein [Planctomycetota bacterium]
MRRAQGVRLKEVWSAGPGGVGPQQLGHVAHGQHRQTCLGGGHGQHDPLVLNGRQSVCRAVGIQGGDDDAANAVVAQDGLEFGGKLADQADVTVGGADADAHQEVLHQRQAQGRAEHRQEQCPVGGESRYLQAQVAQGGGIDVGHGDLKVASGHVQELQDPV